MTIKNPATHSLAKIFEKRQEAGDTIID